jgi:hypothetical protein
MDATYHESLEKSSRDWRAFKLLKISFYGDPNNYLTASDKLFVSLTDGSPLTSDPNNAAIYHPDYTRLNKPWWQDWYIPLSAFTAKDATLDLADVARIHIGIGDMLNRPIGGIGLIYLDDIELLAYGVCIPGSVVGDFTDDCIVNYEDLKIMCDEWLTAGIYADIKADGIVNFLDFAILADNWLVGPVLLGD